MQENALKEQSKSATALFREGVETAVYIKEKIRRKKQNLVNLFA